MGLALRSILVAALGLLAALRLCALLGFAALLGGAGALRFGALLGFAALLFLLLLLRLLLFFHQLFQQRLVEGGVLMLRGQGQRLLVGGDGFLIVAELRQGIAQVVVIVRQGGFAASAFRPALCGPLVVFAPIVGRAAPSGVFE